MALGLARRGSRVANPLCASGIPKRHCQFESKGAQRHLSPSRYGDFVVPLPATGEAHKKSTPLYCGVLFRAANY